MERIRIPNTNTTIRSSYSYSIIIPNYLSHPALYCKGCGCVSSAWTKKTSHLIYNPKILFKLHYQDWDIKTFRPNHFWIQTFHSTILWPVQSISHNICLFVPVPTFRKGCPSHPILSISRFSN